MVTAYSMYKNFFGHMDGQMDGGTAPRYMSTFLNVHIHTAIEFINIFKLIIKLCHSQDLCI